MDQFLALIFILRIRESTLKYGQLRYPLIIHLIDAIMGKGTFKSYPYIQIRFIYFETLKHMFKFIVMKTAATPTSVPNILHIYIKNQSLTKY